MKGLDLRKAAIASKDNEGKLLSAFDMIDAVVNYLRDELNVPVIHRPQIDMPDMADIADRADDLSDIELTLYIARFTGWSSYLESQLSMLRVGHKVAEHNRKTIISELELDLFKKKIPKTETPSRVLQNPMCNEYLVAELKCYAMKEILATTHKAAERGISVISRLITQRETDKKNAGRRIANPGSLSAPRLEGRASGFRKKRRTR